MIMTVVSVADVGWVDSVIGGGAEDAYELARQ